MARIAIQQRRELRAIMELADHEDEMWDAMSDVLDERDRLKSKIKEARESLGLIADLVYVRGDNCSEHIELAQAAIKTLESK